MALQPSDYSAPERLQPGARGEIFKANMPGYRDNADRVNRTNSAMHVSDHDVPNIKFLFDTRLPVLFKYGFAFGFNQIVVPKGRIVATDPNMDLVDFETNKQFSVMTLANGGVPVRVRKTGDNYITTSKNTAIVSTAAQGKELLNIGKEWTPIAGQDKTYTENVMRPFATTDNAVSTPDAQLKAANLSVSPKTGKIVDSTGAEVAVRSGNIPTGIIERNEYTRNDDAYNGIAPGNIRTDALIEMPWFAYKDKAEGNPWGSAYGNLFPGALLRSDENGRFTLSALSFPELVAKMSIAEYELERQQVIGSVYAVNHELVPEGAAEWATWALSDRLNSEEFNPAIYAKNNRKGEDAVNNSPFNSEGKYPGYPYDKNFLNHDLHMLASSMTDNYDPRMNPEYQYSDLGIPGLTDGYNAVVREMPEFKAGEMHYAGGKDYVDMFFRNLDVNVEADSLQISLNDEVYTNCVEGAELKDGAFVIKYASPQQGIIVIAVKDKNKADAFLKPLTNGCPVKFKYKKRGLAGVPTFLDWDGVIGSVHILLQK